MRGYCERIEAPLDAVLGAVPVRFFDPTRARPAERVKPQASARGVCRS
jgi:hypothetical protein